MARMPEQHNVSKDLILNNMARMPEQLQIGQLEMQDSLDPVRTSEGSLPDPETSRKGSKDFQKDSGDSKAALPTIERRVTDVVTLTLLDASFGNKPKSRT